MKMQAVSSSNIREIGYDPESRTLEVKFQGGGRYRYHNVPLEEHERLLNRPLEGSHGRHFNQFIKPRFSSERVA